MQVCCARGCCWNEAQPWTEPSQPHTLGMKPALGLSNSTTAYSDHSLICSIAPLNAMCPLALLSIGVLEQTFPYR